MHVDVALGAADHGQVVLEAFGAGLAARQGQALEAKELPTVELVLELGRELGWLGDLEHLDAVGRAVGRAAHQVGVDLVGQVGQREIVQRRRVGLVEDVVGLRDLLEGGGGLGGGRGAVGRWACGGWQEDQSSGGDRWYEG